MNVLLLADHCNPTFASTPFFGYQIVRGIARAVDRVTLATQVRNRSALSQQELGVHELVFLDSEYVAKPMIKVAELLKRDANKANTLGTGLQYLSNIAFEWEVWKRFRGRLRAGEFDVVHRVTPLSPTLGSPMARWSPVPFVLGPINGGLPWPKAFRAELAREKEWLSYVRGVSKLLPYYRSTYRRAAAVLAGFQHTLDFVPRSCHPRAFVCSDVGFEDQGAPARPPQPTMTAVFVGRLVPYKCPDVLVRAFGNSEVLRRHRLVIIGDGPDRPLLQQLVAEHRLQDCVEFTGWLSHAEVQARLRKADVFAFPSIRELGAGAVIEAMGLGLACVVADYGGPSVYAKNGRGIAVPMTDKAALTAGFQRALETLAGDPDQRQRLGEAARNYVRALHTWDAKARKIRQVYDWVLGRRAERPDFNALP